MGRRARPAWRALNGQPVVRQSAIFGIAAFMEGDNSWHKRVPTVAEWGEALAALAGGDR